MAVAFMMFIKELQVNGGATAISPRIFVLPFLVELYIFELFEPNLLISSRNLP